MKAQQVFGAILLVGLLVILILYILTSQMISAAVMVRAVERPLSDLRPIVLPTVLPLVAAPQPAPFGDSWYIKFDANTWRYRISNKQWNDESQPWHSCDNGLAEMLATLPETPAWHINEFCKKYVFTPVQ